MAAFAGVAQEVGPEAAEGLAQDVWPRQKGAGDDLAPLADEADDFFKTGFALMAPPAYGADLGVPGKEQDGATQARPEFGLDAVGIGTFRLIDPEDGLELPKN